MKYEIEPIINQYFSCHQGVLATYAAYQNRSYDMIFSETWGFMYQREDRPFGTSLNPGYQNRRELLLEKFHGIKVINEQYNDSENLINLIQSKLLQSPIILHCDVFDCPWNISYQRNHLNHYVMIIGFNENSKQVFVLDPYSTKYENIVDIISNAPNSGDVSYFKTMPIGNLQTEDYLLEINNNLNHINNSGFFHNFENFYSEFQTRFAEVMLSDYTDVYAIPLIINLRRIANQRYCYCLFLNKMIKKKYSILPY